MALKTNTIISLNEIPIYILASFLHDYERYTLSLICKDMNKILKSRNYHLFFKKEDQLLSCDSYEIDKRWVNLSSLPDKMKDEDYTVKNYTEVWSKDSNEKIGFLYQNLLISSTKERFFSNGKNMNAVLIH